MEKCAKTNKKAERNHKSKDR